MKCHNLWNWYYESQLCNNYNGSVVKEYVKHNTHNIDAQCFPFFYFTMIIIIIWWWSSVPESSSTENKCVQVIISTMRLTPVSEFLHSFLENNNCLRLGGPNFFIFSHDFYNSEVSHSLPRVSTAGIRTYQ